MKDLEVEVEVCVWKEISLEVLDGNENFYKCQHECAGSDKKCPGYYKLNMGYLKTNEHKKTSTKK